MEFDDQEEQEHEVELRPSYNHDSLLNNNSNSTRLPPTKIPMPIPLEPTEPLSPIRKLNRYKECQKNHAVSIGGHAVDGCGEFMASGPEGTLESLKCASCSCHRNFHRKETDPPAPGFGFHNQHHPHQPLLLTHHPHGGGHFGFRSPTGYLHVAPPRPSGPLTLPSSSGGGGGGGSGNENEDYYSNPSSSGGKKRFRTRFTVEQKDKMLNFAERLGWRIQKQDEEAVQGFCNEIGVRRHVLKVWMHNNKHTLGKKID